MVVKKKREKSGEGPQKCAESLLIPCVFFFSSTPTFILPHHFLVCSFSVTKLFAWEKTERFFGYAQNLKIQGFRTGVIFSDSLIHSQETCCYPTQHIHIHLSSYPVLMYNQLNKGNTLRLTKIQPTHRSDFWKVKREMVIFLLDNMPAFGAVFEIRKTWIWWGKGELCSTFHR